MFVEGGGGPIATTVVVAVATAPAPPSTEATVLVVLLFTPAVVPITLTLKVHEALPAKAAVAKLTVPEPAVAVIVPPPQLPVSPFGVETTRPAGNVSVKPTPVNVVEELGLVMVKPSDVEPFSAMLPAPKDFAIVGGPIAATIILAEAVLPGPLSTEVTVPVVLFLVPTVTPVTFTLKVHAALAASAAPVKVTLPDPAVAVIAPAPQLPVSPFGVETTRPAGSESVKPTPVNGVPALALVIVNASDAVPPTPMFAAPNDFPIVGGRVTAPVGIRPMRLPVISVNHRLPSGPAVMEKGWAPAVIPPPNSVLTPAVVIRPILLPLCSANQRFPSGPAVMPTGTVPTMGRLNSVTTPAVVIRPIRGGAAEMAASVYHILPSGPSQIP